MHKLTIHTPATTSGNSISTLCSNKQIDALFNGPESQSASAFPVRVIYSPVELPAPSDQPEHILPLSSRGGARGGALFSVPKRHFKHAVDRNRVKRQLREAFSQHAHLLHLDEKPMLIAFIWLDNKHYPSSVISRKIKRLMERIKK